MRTDRPYVADTAIANRLYAARRAAGFRSVRELAVKTGWSEAAFRAHETATRKIDDLTLRTYAAGLGVAYAWLAKGVGSGPPVDELRAKKFEARKKHAERTAPDHPVTQTARRLRLARRLAGFRTITDAARGLGLKRSNLAAHESGQNGVSGRAAKLYASAFGCTFAWLREGALPSGYGADVERRMPALLDLHDHLDSAVQDHLPAPTAKAPKPSLLRRIAKANSARPPKPKPMEILPELAQAQLVKLVSRSDWQREINDDPAHTWAFPPGYLLERYGCRPGSAFVIAAPYDMRGANRFDRMIVDIAPAPPVWGAYYLLLDVRSGRLKTVKRSDTRNTPSDDHNDALIGRVCSVDHEPRD